MDLDRAISAIKREGTNRAAKIAAREGFQKLLTVQLIDDLCYRYSLRQLQSCQSNEEDVDSILETAYQFSGVGRYRTIAPIQVRAELATVAQLIAAHEPRTVLEIGTDNGGTFYTWCRCLESTDTVLSLDLPGGSTPPEFLDSITPTQRQRSFGGIHVPLRHGTRLNRYLMASRSIFSFSTAIIPSRASSEISSFTNRWSVMMV